MNHFLFSAPQLKTLTLSSPGPWVSQGGLATQTTGSNTFQKLSKFSSLVFPQFFGQTPPGWAPNFLVCRSGAPTRFAPSPFHIPFSAPKGGMNRTPGAGAERPGWKIPQVTRTLPPWAQWGRAAPRPQALLKPPRPAPRYPPFGPRGSPLSSLLAAASESPEGGGRGGRRHRTTWASVCPGGRAWARFPEMWPAGGGIRRGGGAQVIAAGRGGGATPAGTAPPERPRAAALPQPVRDSPSLGTRGRRPGWPRSGRPRPP